MHALDPSAGLEMVVQWQYRNQWGSTDVWLLLIADENLLQYDVTTMWITIGVTENVWSWPLRQAGERSGLRD